MQARDLTRSLTSLFSELTLGAPKGSAFVLNGGDPGLLRTLDALPASAASASRDGGGTIAAHVAHLQYGLSLMNRWAEGEDPFADADWSKAWETGAVSDEEWALLREELSEEAERWHVALQQTRELSGAELDGVLASIIHLAYHLGAIRQIDRAARGPKATD